MLLRILCAALIPSRHGVARCFFTEVIMNNLLRRRDGIQFTQPIGVAPAFFRVRLE